MYLEGAPGNLDSPLLCAREGGADFMLDFYPVSSRQKSELLVDLWHRIHWHFEGSSTLVRDWERGAQQCSQGLGHPHHWRTSYKPSLNHDLRSLYFCFRTSKKPS
jgi:hypothetical protein